MHGRKSRDIHEQEQKHEPDDEQETCIGIGIGSSRLIAIWILGMTSSTAHHRAYWPGS